jgi:hypothetical protein
MSQEIKLTIKDDLGNETERVFKPAPLTMKTEAFFHKARIKARDADLRGWTTDAKQQSEQVQSFIESDPETLNECMRLAYVGNHDGIDWATMESADVITMLTFFLLRRGNNLNEIVSRITNSLSDTTTASVNLPTKTQSKTRTSSKSKSGDSRKASLSTTT